MEGADDGERGADVREPGADDGEHGADGREQGADGREQGADGRERGADGREQEADGRERGADGREREADERTGRWADRGGQGRTGSKREAFRQSVRPPAHPPRPHFQKFMYEFVLVEIFLPLVHHVRLPRLQFLAPTGAIVASG